MSRRRLSLALAALLHAGGAAAETRQDEQFWLNATVMGSISGPLVYFAEVQPRLGDGVSRLDQLLLRPAIGWKLSPKVTVYQGYAHVVVPVAGGRDRNEERSFQQVTWIMAAGRGRELSSRSRFEQRWRSDGSDVGFRLREMLRYEAPLGREPRGVKALGSVEAFVALNDTDWGARGGFDQLRSFAGVEVPLRGASTIEIGYLNQVIDQTRGAVRVNHVASVNLFLRP